MSTDNVLFSSCSAFLTCFTKAWSTFRSSLWSLGHPLNSWLSLNKRPFKNIDWYSSCLSVHLNNIYLDYYVINNNPLLLLLYIYLITFWIQNISVVSHSVFRGTHHWVPRSQRLFGGQIVGQALVAAAKSVSDNLYAHSLHCYFVRAGKMQPQVKGTRQRL